MLPTNYGITIAFCHMVTAADEYRAVRIATTVFREETIGYV
jgi:hypothetical protein